MNFLTEREQREAALVQTAQNLVAMLAVPSTKEALSTFRIKTHTEQVESDYGSDFERHYTLVIPDKQSGLIPMLITDAEIVYLSSVTGDNTPLTRLNEVGIANLYQAITDERPDEFQRRRSQYNPSAPCKINVGGITFNTERNTQSTSADEILENMKGAEATVITLNERQRPTFGGGNRFAQAAERIRQQQIDNNTASNNNGGTR